MFSVIVELHARDEILFNDSLIGKLKSIYTYIHTYIYIKGLFKS